MWFLLCLVWRGSMRLLTLRYLILAASVIFGTLAFRRYSIYSPNVNRRSFVSGVAGTVVAASADRLSAAEPSRRRVIIGFLGASHSHALAKVKIVSASSDYELIGIAEESADVRKRYAELKIRWRPPAE